jgi:superfamily II DNA or RNA helicase
MYKPSFTLEDLTHWLGWAELEKGKPYISQVRDVKLGPEWITARIQGSARRPYSVVATYTPVPSGTLFEAECSCPIGYRCKHIAAIYLYWMQMVEKTVPHQEKSKTPNQPQEVLTWLEQLVGHLRQTEEPPKRAPKKTTVALKLLYCVRPAGRSCAVSLWKAKQHAGGEWQATENWNNIERALRNQPRFVADEDLPLLLKLYQSGGARHGGVGPEYILEGDAAVFFLKNAVATGRLVVFEPHNVTSVMRVAPLPLLRAYQLGEVRSGQLGWRIQQDGSLRAVLQFDSEARVLLGSPYWYADHVRHEIGPAQISGVDSRDMNADLLDALLHAPALDPVSVPLVAKVLKDHGLELLAPDAELSTNLQVIDVDPTLRLNLNTIRHQHYVPHPPYHENYLDYADLRFIYQGYDLQRSDKDVFVADAGGATIHIKRHIGQEQAAVAILKQKGLVPLHTITYLSDNHSARTALGLPESGQWARFVEETVPELRAQGWDVIYAPDFQHACQEIDAWHGDLQEEEGGGWFNLAMGIEVAGQQLALQPLLSELFARDKRWLAQGGLDTIPDTESIMLIAAGVGRIGVKAERLKPIVSVLIDLFDGPATETLRISSWDAARLEDLVGLADRERWQFKAHEAIVQLARRLRGTDMPEVQAPAGFKAQLRPYQLDGLRWLQYLRSQDLSGVLADDMGLGKTAQSIAHLQTEYEAGRMDKPALVVMPTSLLFNWSQELARFAPELKVLTLHGQSRKEVFGQIPDHQVVLTTYPLLWRDADELQYYQYHMLILDEAQSVKNAASKAAGVVRCLQARHRLALTGTPLENHLGELWSLFDYLLPGFLGDAKTFTKRWRTPIEKQGDRTRANLLARRIRPFILRRKKEDVARELPPKTIIVRTVELEAAQRDLYETVRVAMDEKVRQEIASKGFKRSQIIILDALLKLRQACCDPGLVKLAAARKVKQSAKLELLMEMLPELISEGRRILLFSQFTSMLETIETQLARHKIHYVKLTGSTRDRATPVAQFQAGMVPLFLISLKAGGVGLNLTAADTVIHYDPWWNPAVENQATDRAHRIGQDKNVFVYKLVVAGSIEEKIMALQEKKAELAEGILSEDGGELSKFNENDIAALLEALPE